MKPVLTLFASVAAALILGGCMAQGSFPSLAVRDVERQSLSEPVRPIPVIADNLSLRARIEELVGLASRADAAFGQALGPAQSAARAAGARGSDSWAAAQEQVSRLEASRAGTTRALADLDRLALERSDRPTSSSDQAVLTSALQTVQQMAADQQNRIDQLKVLIAR